MLAEAVCRQAAGGPVTAAHLPPMCVSHSPWASQITDSLREVSLLLIYVADIVF